MGNGSARDGLVWGYTVDSWVKDTDNCDVVGVMLTSNNGETQYLTMKEYVKLTKNRNERKEE